MSFMALTDVWLSPAVVLVVIGITMASAMPVFSGASSPPTPLMLVINESYPPTSIPTRQRHGDGVMRPTGGCVNGGTGADVFHHSGVECPVGVAGHLVLQRRIRGATFDARLFLS